MKYSKAKAKNYKNLMVVTSMALAACVLNLTACGKAEIAPDFQPYVDSFKADAARFNRTINISEVSIHFGTLTQAEADAECHVESKDIIVDKTLWDRREDTDKMVLVYHELGHCVMGLGHTASGIMQGIPFAGHLSPQAYIVAPEAYLSEFFKE